MSTLIGTDPEAFVVDGDKKVISVGLIGGSKYKPRPVEGGAVQEDNVLAEFNVDPASTANQFVDNFNHVAVQLEQIIAPLTLCFEASHEFDMAEIHAGGEQALTLGCEPDTNCWTEDQNDAPNGFATSLRTAGGHIHIGVDNPSVELGYSIACACEYLLGVPSVLLDGDNRRRQLYGSAGACRIKEYGVEYRVLSNFWCATDDLKRWAFSNAQASVGAVSKLDEWTDKFPPHEIMRIINTGDTEAAAKVVAELDIPMPEV